MPIAKLCQVKMPIAELCQVKMPITELCQVFLDKSTAPGTVTWYNKLEGNGQHTNKLQTTHTHTYTML